MGPFERLEIKDRPDFLSGLLFIALGVFGMVEAVQYDMGTLRRMGAGYFPFILSGILVLLGIVTAVTSLSWRRADDLAGGAAPGGDEEGRAGEEDENGGADVLLALRAVVFVIGALVLFAVALPRLGLVLSVMLLVFVSSFAERSLTWRATAVIAVVMAFIAVAVFRRGIGLPFSVWPR